MEIITNGLDNLIYLKCVSYNFEFWYIVNVFMNLDTYLYDYEYDIMNIVDLLLDNSNTEN